MKLLSTQTSHQSTPIHMSHCVPEPKRPRPLQFAPEIPSVILPEQDLAIRVRVEDDLVQGIQLAGPMEHVLVHIAVIPPQTAVQLPIREFPRIDQANGV